MNEAAQNLHEALYWRYAVRKFSNQLVSDGLIKQLLNDTRLSASAFGLQPYKILVIQNHQLKGRLLEASYNQQKVLENSHLLVFVADMSCVEEMINQYTKRMWLYNDWCCKKQTAMKQSMLAALSGMNEEQQYQWASKQAYIALGTLLVSAASLKIDACPMSGIDTQRYDEILRLCPQNLKTVAICPIGYRHPLDSSANANKVRKPLEELVVEVD
ncbi:NAD(P)H-dependent oxidoreductase [Pseudoalteromonas sp. T1lg23B]|uniref:NAD(P)H-dependent oxidoreductase n=1 Tax=Pseudoalteromonas sp. T1lg23B TaxID=2077097 RepID=UPI000CF7044B|nr:NAD(P)H-dependent oxidoreductase [Pseudoalteromonas sp. T1lg23B]